MASSLAAENPQTTEVSAVKGVFPGRCRVIKDIGIFTHVVTVQPQNLDATLKFQLTEPYPSTIPEISIRSESLTDEDSEELQKQLTDQARQLLGQPMLQVLIAEAEHWLKGHGIRPGKSVKANAEVFLTDAKKKPKKPKGKMKKTDEDDEDQKKPSMKTAMDVINRILWDDKLDRDDFLVGYLDRFKGIQEKYFSAFSWEDIASVDYDVLAVPKHRIQYFKYRQQKIWDKPTRMDNVFGSTGSGMTVYDVINNYQETSQGGVGEKMPVNGSAEEVEGKGEVQADDCSDDDSDDSDDGITVTIGSSVNTRLPEKSFQHTEDTNFDEDVDDAPYNPYWRDKLRPNYFLALRITDAEIRQGVEQVQDYLLDNEPVYAPCCIPPHALHITLCTLGLDTPEQVALAKDILKKIQPEIESVLPKGPITLEGVANFYNRVVYAKVQQQQDFLDFVDYVRLLVKEAGLEIRDSHDFVPHVTIMKVTRPVAREKGTKNVDQWLYSNFSDMHFGKQKVNAIYLCSMGDDRGEDGFYICPAEIHFSDSAN